MKRQLTLNQNSEAELLKNDLSKPSFHPNDLQDHNRVLTIQQKAVVRSQTHRLQNLCDPRLKTIDFQSRQLYPGYDQEKELDDFDDKYKLLVTSRLKNQQRRDIEINNKLV